MDKYERRRLRLLELRDTQCNRKVVTLANKIGRDASYVSRLLYPAGKAGAKRMADDMMEVIEKAFNEPRYWLDQESGTTEFHKIIPHQQEKAAYSDAILAGIAIMEKLDAAGQGRALGRIESMRDEIAQHESKQQKSAGRTGTR